MSSSQDADGNLTANGSYTYTWDGENWLIEPRPTSPAEESKNLVLAYGLHVPPGAQTGLHLEHGHPAADKQG